jgi:hypothetical protein
MAAARAMGQDLAEAREYSATVAFQVHSCDCLTAEQSPSSLNDPRISP